MDQITQEYVNKALDLRIKKVTEFIQWQENIIEDCDKTLNGLESKISIGGGLAATFIESQEDAKTRRAAAAEKLEAHREHLKNYQHAKSNFNK